MASGCGCRARGDELVCVHVGRQGAREVARHLLTTPGNWRINPDHYTERTNDPLYPRARATGAAEKAFLQIGPGAESWLIEAAASGAQRVRTKMVRAVELKALISSELIDRALGRAAAAGRRRKEVGFPSGKTCEAWVAGASSIPLPTQNGLRTLEWIHRRECLSFSGPSGTGKSHFVEALGHLAIDQGMRVSWFSLERLATTVARSKVAPAG